MGRRRWPVPEIASVGALATFLGLSDGELAWLADARGLERTVTDEPLRHYRYATRWRPGRPVRVIERPKQRLKETQRRILHEILDRIPVHDAAHGFTRGRSVRTHASEHTGQYVIVRLDLEDFFASIAASGVYAMFRTAGYPESVAYSLTALTTNVVASTLWQSVPRPINPTQINAHRRLGRRLSGLAASLEISYSRYADDLTFPGPPRLVRTASTLRRAVAEIARDKDSGSTTPAQLARARASVAEPASSARLPSAPARTHRLDRLAEPATGREATSSVRRHRLERGPITRPESRLSLTARVRASTAFGLSRVIREEQVSCHSRRLPRLPPGPAAGRAERRRSGRAARASARPTAIVPRRAGGRPTLGAFERPVCPVQRSRGSSKRASGLVAIRASRVL